MSRGRSPLGKEWASLPTPQEATTRSSGSGLAEKESRAKAERTAEEKEGSPQGSTTHLFRKDRDREEAVASEMARMEELLSDRMAEAA